MTTSNDPTPVEDDKQLLMGEPSQDADDNDDDDDNQRDETDRCSAASTEYTRPLPIPMNGSQWTLSSFHRSHASYSHMWAVVFTLIVATATAVSFPPYLDAINTKSDAYTALMFSSLCILCILTCTTVAVKIRNRDWHVVPPLHWGKVLTLGFYLGLSGIFVFYARDRDRVLCHLQDPLAASVLPIAVVCHFFFSARVDNTRKLFCLAATIIGLFVCIDFQIWDEFSCHGHPNHEMFDEIRPWTSEQNAIWTIVYLAGLALFGLFVTVLEREMKGDKPECLVATIALTPTTPTIPVYTDSVSEDLNEVLIQPPKSVHPIKHTSPYVNRSKTIEIFHKNQVLLLATWIQLVSFCTILLFAWTDLFSFIGKAGSTSSFNELTRNGISCHFSLAYECGGVAPAAWPFIVFGSLFVLSVVYLINYSGTCSAPYAVALVTMCLPLSAFCWSFFKTDGGFHWDPSFTGETGFTVVGLPIMSIALAFYRFYARKELSKL